MTNNPRMLEVLRKSMKASGLSGNRLAREVGLSQPTIWAFMTGRQDELILSSVQKLCDYFGLVLVPKDKVK